MKKKKTYEAPQVKRVSLDIKSSIMGNCQMSPDNIIGPSCNIPGSVCPTYPPYP